MSIVTDAKVKELDGKVRQLELMVQALKKKLDEVEITASRNKRIPRENKNDNRDSQWVQPTIR